MRQIFQVIYLMFMVATSVCLLIGALALVLSQPTMAASMFHTSFWTGVIFLALIGIDVVVF